MPQNLSPNPLHNLIRPFNDPALRNVAYQDELRCLVCISCGICVRRSQLYGHLTGPGHSLKLRKMALENVVSNSGLAFIPDTEDLRPPPGKIEPIPWLQAEIHGIGCVQCSYCCANRESMRKHWEKSHRGEKGKRSIERLYQSALMQRFFISGLSSVYFRVSPTLRGSTVDSGFGRFYNSLPDKWRNGDLTEAVSKTDGKSGEFDLPPFLAKSGWALAVKGFSAASLKAKVSDVRPAEKSYLQAIKGLGYDYLSSIQNLNNVHPTILEGLTRWRNY